MKKRFLQTIAFLILILVTTITVFVKYDNPIQAATQIPSTLNITTIPTTGGNRIVTYVEINLNAGYEIRALTAQETFGRASASFSEFINAANVGNDSDSIIFPVNFFVTATYEIVGAVVSQNRAINSYPQPWLNYGVGFTPGNIMSLFHGRLNGNHIYGYNWDDPRLDYVTAFNPYPHLIKNGHRLDIQPTGAAPRNWLDQRVRRSFMGQRADGTFIVGTVNGTSINELQEIAAYLNLYNATNIDGGASASIWRNSEYILRPSRNLASVMVITSTEAANMPHATTTPPASEQHTSSGALRFPIGSTSFTNNGVTQTLEAAPFIQDNRTMVPLRVISEALGATNLAHNAGVITFNINNQSFTMTVGQQLPGNMGTPVIIADRTFVPLAFIINEMGATARWDSNARAAYIYIAEAFPRTHIVVAGESMVRIAIIHYGNGTASENQARANIIAEYNNIDPNQLLVGLELIIPALPPDA